MANALIGLTPDEYWYKYYIRVREPVSDVESEDEDKYVDEDKESLARDDEEEIVEDTTGVDAGMAGLLREFDKEGEEEEGDDGIDVEMATEISGLCIGDIGVGEGGRWEWRE